MSKVIYALKNPAMPGLIKIGVATNIEQRMRDLYKTGVPVPFECLKAIEMAKGEAQKAEKALLAFGEPLRINPKREFFEVEDEKILAIMDVLKGKDVTHKVNKQNKKNLDKQSIDAGKKLAKKMGPNFNLIEMGIDKGSVIESLEHNKKAEVIGKQQVLFEGQNMTLTEATHQFITVTYRIRPIAYWHYKGRSLIDIYNDTYIHP